MNRRPAQAEAMRRSWSDPEVRLGRALGVIRRRHDRRVAQMRARGVPEELIAVQEERLAMALESKKERST